MAKPNERQLQLINRMAIDPLEEDEVYVFKTLMIDDQETSYISKIHPNLLRTFLKDASKGVGLMLSHDTEKLPVGRTYSAELKEEYDNNSGDILKSLYGEVYIGLGRNTESGMTTDDIAKGISNGTIFDVSIGFSAEQFNCSCCGNDIRSWDCPHIPGKTYEIEEDGIVKNKRCEVIVGENGAGNLRELSLVYAGACDRASIKRNLETYSVKSENKLSKLHDVENIKDVPFGTEVYMQFSKDGCYMYYGEKETQKEKNPLTNTELASERVLLTSDIIQEVKEEQMVVGKLEEERSVFVDTLELLRTKLNLEIDSEDQLAEKIEDYVKSVQDLNESLSALSEDKENLKTELEASKTELEVLMTEKTSLEENLSLVTKEKESLEGAVEELKAINEELSLEQEEIRKELISSTLEAGIRTQGNAFQADLFEKFLLTLTQEEIKVVKEGFENDFKQKFQKFSKTEDRALQNRSSEPKTREDFETEHEFRTFVAEKALLYAKENNVSVADATRFMMKQFNTKGSEK
jgi:hypothetical protein